ncbi:hypothetical protein C8J57DRAFT_1673663 [Mycena rebaudengoi]|nr:hypothetical protein C8J57DRAFT_1673663 [Mycena rebaudengoi]
MPKRGTVVKRARVTPLPGSLTQIAISSSRDKSKGLIRCMIRSVQQTSGLDAGVVRTKHSHVLGLVRVDHSNAPIVSLAGAHGTSQRAPQTAACRSGPNANYGLLSSLTKAPIIGLQWSLVSPRQRSHAGRA